MCFVPFGPKYTCPPITGKMLHGQRTYMVAAGHLSKPLGNINIYQKYDYYLGVVSQYGDWGKLLCG